MALDTTPPAAPTLKATTPSSPANDSSPEVEGIVADLDLVTGNATGDSVSVLQGTGNGTFGAPVDYPAGDGPEYVVAGDFNGDGLPDVAVPDYYTDKVSILLGLEDGSLGLKTEFTVGDGPTYAATADFDADGDLDLAVANLGAGSVSILLNNGAGSFGAPANIDVWDEVWSVASGDLNGDGDPDLVVTSRHMGGKLSVLLGAAGASFAGPTHFSAGDQPRSPALADFDRDGDLDVAVVNHDADQVRVLTGDGAGAFSYAGAFAVDYYPRSIAVEDFNQDSDPDLAVANQESDNVTILLGATGASFTLGAHWLVGDAPFTIAAGHLSSDGDPDLAVANLHTDNVSVLVGTSFGSFTGPTHFTTGVDPLGVAMASFGSDVTSLRLYVNDEPCSGAPAATGSRAAFEGLGITVPVGDDQISQLRARAVDEAGNPSDCSASLDYDEDSTPPTVSNVTSTKPDGTYGPGTVIDVRVVFNQAVVVTGIPRLTLETGTSDAAATYMSGSGTTTPTFRYTVVAGNTSPDLDYTSTGALALSGGTIRDQAGNDANLTLPAPGGTGSLAANKNIEIDTTAPDPPTITDTDPNSPANDNLPAVKGDTSAPTARLYSGADCSGPMLATGTSTAFSNPGFTPTSPIPGDETTTFRATAVDSVGNTSGCSAGRDYIEDSTAQTPAFTGTNPASGSNDNNPRFLGTAEADSTVWLHDNPGCTGADLGTGTTAQFANPGIAVTVADNSTTTLYAHITDQVGNQSLCSAGITYAEVTPPPLAPQGTAGAVKKKCKKGFKRKKGKCVRKKKRSSAHELGGLFGF